LDRPSTRNMQEDNAMNIVVCIKQVPDAESVKWDHETGTLIRDGVKSVINPFDYHAIEAALTLRDQLGGKVTAVTMGPPQAEDALREDPELLQILREVRDYILGREKSM